MEATLIIGLTFLTISLWGWALIDISRSRFKSPMMNTIWLLIVLFLPAIGSVFYFQMKKSLTTNEPRRFQSYFNGA